MEIQRMKGISLGAFPSLSEAAAEIAGRAREGVVAVRSGRGGQGSGVIWTEDGVIVTNHHVVASERAEVVLSDGRQLPAIVVRRDRPRDLAVLRAEATSLPAIPVGDSRNLRPGQLVLAVGNPFGVRGAVSVGIISGLLGEVRAGGRRLSEMVRADIDLYPGNSGGPLLDVRGRVVGVNTMVTGPGAALAVPSHLVLRVLDSPAAGRAFIGVTAREVPMLAGAGSPFPTRMGSGLLVQGVVAGSPAERAGMLAGDLVVAMDGAPLGNRESVSERLEMLAPHSTCTLSVLRAGKLLRVQLRPEQRN
jgi:serine protease Do